MVKNIIFDFGGVLLNLDYQKTFDALSELLGRKIDMHHLSARMTKVLLAYEKGEIKTESFIWHLQKASNLGVPQGKEIADAWNAMLLGWNSERFAFLKELKKSYRLFLLSNTNELHIEWVQKDLKNNHSITNFEKRFFDKVYYSHEVEMRKPQANIYQHVLEDAKINAAETLFIDDNADNVAGAEAAGILSVLHNPQTEIIEQLPIYLKQH